MAKTTAPAPAKTTKLPKGVPRTANGKRLGRPTEAERLAAGKAPAVDTKAAKAVKAPKAAKVVKAPVAKKAVKPVAKKAVKAAKPVKATKV
jgi:hypothetical protein